MSTIIMNRAPRIGALLQSKLQNLDFQALTEWWRIPVSLHFGDIFLDTVNFWKRWLDDVWVPYHIAFAFKATWQQEYIPLCKEWCIGLDVASHHELRAAINGWIASHQIIANWPKNSCFLADAIQSWCIIAVNSRNELLQLQHILQGGKYTHPVKVLCRVKTPWSRFWIPYDAFYSNAFLEHRFDWVSLVWLSFHSDTIELSEKEQSIQLLVRLQEHLAKRWHTIEYLNIWWGYRVKYCEERLLKQWPREYYQGWWVYGLTFLDDLLHCTIDWQPFYEYCLESFTTLIVEPWRALLDQAWILIHTVLDANDYHITIDGNIYSTWAIAQEMPHDPILICRAGRVHLPSYTNDAYHRGVYWNLCLESDRLVTRTIPFPQAPNVWDHLIFINTAWYFADFSHAMPLGHTDRKTIFM
jgi:diaminopimelate decarboxylase